MNETEKRSGTALLQRGEKAEEAGEREREKETERSTSAAAATSEREEER